MWMIINSRLSLFSPLSLSLLKTASNMKLVSTLVTLTMALVGAHAATEVPTTPSTLDSPAWFNASFPRGSDAVFHGLVKENWLENRAEAKIEVSPQIIATAPQGICGFTILESSSQTTSPFIIKQVESAHPWDGSGVEPVEPRETSARAELILRRRVDCEKNRRFKVDVAAKACGSNKQVKGTVYVDVVDVNEFAPEFPQSSYTIDVNERRLYDKIVQVRASDRDCSPDFGDVCGYEILTPNEPFQIDREGNIKNTEELDWTRKRNHILAIVAFDCAQNRGHQVMVNIIVNRVCRPALRGVNEHLSYAPGAGQQTLLGDHAHLDLCQEHACEVDKLTAYIQLETKHIGKGCDRDTYSIKSQRKICGALSGAVDLLPSPGQEGGRAWGPAAGAGGDREEEEGRGEDQIYAFDGETNAVVIPDGILDGESPLGNHFTISAWMKHHGLPSMMTKKERKEGGKHQRHPGHKEEIICNSDDHNMNRHHFSLFLTAGKLHFLLRQKAGDDQNVFKPAEWRWALDQVDDGEWHHYAVNVDFPNVQLFVDGRPFKVVEGRNPKIVDDWPLHRMKDGKTKTVVGACWHGGQQRMFQHFKGYLAGLTVLLGKSENPDVIQCLHNCKEGLDYLDMAKVPEHSRVTFNSDMTEVTLNSHSTEDFNSLLERVTYTNTRSYPTPGHRPVIVRTTVSCKNEKVVTVPDLRLYVQVGSRDRPSIHLAATFEVSQPDFVIEKGVRIFPDLEIVARGDEAQSARLGLPSPLSKLDSCIVEAKTLLDPKKERLRFPEHLLATLQLEANFDGQKLTIAGADHPYNYQEVLRQIVFVNVAPEAKDSQAFTVRCSEQNGRFTSNVITVQLNNVHAVREHPAEVHVAHSKKNVMEVEYKDAGGIKEISLGGVKKAEPSSSTASVMTVVALGFVAFVAVIGIIRYRASRNGAAGNDGANGAIGGDDYHWVDELNIIVNPMEEQGSAGGVDDEDQELPLRDDFSEDSEMSDREMDLEQGDLEDLSTEDEDEMPGVTIATAAGVKELRSCRGLEWDDSTI